MSINSIKKLSKALSQASQDQEVNAAVALLLKRVDEDFEVFVVRRVENPNDPWSGQMSLPGGKREAEDQNLMQTVVRETLEETRINLLDRCRFLGVMNPSRSTRRPEIKILPFVFHLEHEPKIELNEEMEWSVWISLKELTKKQGTAKFSFGEFPAYIIDGTIIWGLTYRILAQFVQILENSQQTINKHSFP